MCCSGLEALPKTFTFQEITVSTDTGPASFRANGHYRSRRAMARRCRTSRSRTRRSGWLRASMRRYRQLLPERREYLKLIPELRGYLSQ